MNTDSQHRLILQILIGSAWVDHTLNDAETAYLQTVLDRYHLSNDTALQTLLAKPVAPKQTERWIVTFLKGNQQEERLKLLASIGQLLIADDVVSDIEHDLLDEYHDLMAKISDEPDHIGTLARNIGKYVGKTLQNLANKL